MQGILSFDTIRYALAGAGVTASRTGWQGQKIRQGDAPTDFVLISIDGSEQPWSKPSDDLLARDWIVHTPAEGSQASPAPTE